MYSNLRRSQTQHEAELRRRVQDGDAVDDVVLWAMSVDLLDSFGSGSWDEQYQGLLVRYGLTDAAWRASGTRRSARRPFGDLRVGPNVDSSGFPESEVQEALLDESAHQPVLEPAEWNDQSYLHPEPRDLPPIDPQLDAEDARTFLEQDFEFSYPVPEPRFDLRSTTSTVHASRQHSQPAHAPSHEILVGLEPTSSRPSDLFRTNPRPAPHPYNWDWPDDRIPPAYYDRSPDFPPINMRGLTSAEREDMRKDKFRWLNRFAPPLDRNWGWFYGQEDLIDFEDNRTTYFYGTGCYDFEAWRSRWEQPYGPGYWLDPHPTQLLPEVRQGDPSGKRDHHPNSGSHMMTKSKKGKKVKKVEKGRKLPKQLDLIYPPQARFEPGDYETDLPRPKVIAGGDEDENDGRDEAPRGHRRRRAPPSEGSDGEVDDVREEPTKSRRRRRPRDSAADAPHSPPPPPPLSRRRGRGNASGESRYRIPIPAGSRYSREGIARTRTQHRTLTSPSPSPSPPPRQRKRKGKGDGRG